MYLFDGLGTFGTPADNVILSPNVEAIVGGTLDGVDDDDTNNVVVGCVCSTTMVGLWVLVGWDDLGADVECVTVERATVECVDGTFVVEPSLLGW